MERAPVAAWQHALRRGTARYRKTMARDRPAVPLPLAARRELRWKGLGGFMTEHLNTTDTKDTKKKRRHCHCEEDGDEPQARRPGRSNPEQRPSQQASIAGDSRLPRRKSTGSQ